MQSTAKVTLCVGDDWDECEATARQESLVPEHGGGIWENNGTGPGKFGGAGCLDGSPTSVLNNKCKDWSTTLYYRTIGIYAFIYDGTPFNHDSAPTAPEGAVQYCTV